MILPRFPSSSGRSLAFGVGLACALGGVAIGALLGYAGPLITVAVVTALALAAWALSDL